MKLIRTEEEDHYILVYREPALERKDSLKNFMK